MFNYFILKEIMRFLRRNFKFIFICIFTALLFLVLKSNGVFAATTITGVEFGDTLISPETLTPLTLNTDTESYYILTNSNVTSIVVIEPANPSDYLVLYNYSSTYTFAGYNPSTKNLRGLSIHTSNYSNNSWSSWSVSTVNNNTSYAPGGSSGFASVKKSNIGCYVTGYGAVGSDFIPNSIPLPNGIKLTDNICLAAKSNTHMVLAYTPNDTFTWLSGSTYLRCRNSNNGNEYYDLYHCPINTSSFVFQGSVNDGAWVMNMITTRSNNYTGGIGNFFSFMYEYDEFPEIINTTEDLATGASGSVIVTPGDFKPSEKIFFEVYRTGAEVPDYVTTLDDESEFYYTSEGSFGYEIPFSEFENILQVGVQFNYVLYWTYNGGLGTFGLVATWGGLTEDDNQINQQLTETNAKLDITNQQLISTNTKLDDLNTNITDSTVDNSSIYLPSDNSSDITATGLNGIFTSIYNAFCTGQAQDIVFPIPFTNKNITLQANYVRQMLQNSGASWVITIIEAFWWYLISRFIIKDITSKITKIKSGNIESIENTNIKGDML